MLVRHSRDDASYIDGKNDTDLTAEGIAMAKKTALDISKIVSPMDTNIAIYSSSKKRTIQTSDIIAEQLAQDKIPFSLASDARLNEIYQGNMLINGLTHEEKRALLHYAWVAFKEERDLGNYNYHFAQPHDKLLKNFVTPPYGETHNEYCLRLAQALACYIDTNQKQPMFSLLVLHGGSINHMLNMTYALNSNDYTTFLDKKKFEQFTNKVAYCAVQQSQIKDVATAKIMLDKYIYTLQKDIKNANICSK